jgi:DNA repair/transcription protein MET18/MMS19
MDVTPEVVKVFQPVDVATEQQALVTLQVLITTIYSSDDDSLADQDMQGLAREACEECIQILREPEKSQAKPATKILCSFITTTRELRALVINPACSRPRKHSCHVTPFHRLYRT